VGIRANTHQTPNVIQDNGQLRDRPGKGR
jgi:hypothetical protein